MMKKILIYVICFVSLFVSVGITHADKIDDTLDIVMERLDNILDSKSEKEQHAIIKKLTQRVAIIENTYRKSWKTQLVSLFDRFGRRLANRLAMMQSYQLQQPPVDSTDLVVNDVTTKLWSLADLREELLDAINDERASEWLAAVSLDDKLATASQWHAEYMADTSDFNHTTKAGESFVDRINTAWYTYLAAGENIARWQQSVEEVLQARMQSPGHRANILGDQYTEVGFGFANYYRVNKFGKPTE